MSLIIASRFHREIRLAPTIHGNIRSMFARVRVGHGERACCAS
jgi:hypothetical protein